MNHPNTRSDTKTESIIPALSTTVTEHPALPATAAESMTLFTKAAERLRRPGELRQRVENLCQRREICQARCTRMTGAYNGVRVQGNGSGPENGLIALADIERELTRTMEDLTAACQALREILDRAASMPDRTANRDALLLDLRYLRGRSWEGVRTELAYAGFPATSRTIYHWHHAALKRLCVVTADGFTEE